MSRNTAGVSSSSTSDSASRRHRATYLCRRCPGVEVEEGEREAHRLAHIQEDVALEAAEARTQTRSQKRESEDNKKARKPGPKSKTARRSPSPSEVSSMFTQKRREDRDEQVGRNLRARPSASPRGGDGAGASGGQGPPRQMGAKEKARLERARAQHFKNAPVFHKKFLGA